MELSIIVCTFNRCSFLKSGLDEIIRQILSINNSDIELIIVDNNSIDNTSELVKNYKKLNPNISILYFLEKNQGISFSRNRAIKESNGNFIAFIDDDAVINENWLVSLIDAINHIDAQVFGGPIYPNFEIPCPDWIDSNYYVRKFLKKNGYLKGLDLELGFSGGNMCFNKKIFNEIGVFNTNLGMAGNKLGLGEETEFFSRLYHSPINGRLYNLQEMSISHFESALKLDEKYLKSRIILSGEGFSKRCFGQNKIRGFFLVFVKLAKQLMTSVFYLIQIPIVKKNKFRFYKCMWVIQGLLRGIIKF